MRASRPPRTQTPIAGTNSGTSLATAAGFLKTPEPITVPMTIAVVIHGPRTRGSADSCGGEVVAMADSVLHWLWIPRGIFPESTENFRYRKGNRGGPIVFTEFW